MISAIVHQIFWTSISFALFYLAMNSFVFKKLDKINQKRISYIQKMQDQLLGLEKKTQALEATSKKILTEEIPQKEEFYLNRTLEPIMTDLEIEYSYKKQLLQEHLENRRTTQTGEVLIPEIGFEKLAKELVAKVVEKSGENPDQKRSKIL